MTRATTGEQSDSGAASDREEIVVVHVDDQQEFVDLTTTCLEREAETLSVVGTTSASEALSYLDEEGDHVDCVVSDYEMPRTDGLELLESVRDEFPELPFILFTGKGSEEIASEAISAGVTEYLRKRPGTQQFELLANRIRNTVEKHRAQRRAATQRDRLRTIADHAPVVLFALDSDGTFTHSTGRALQSLGLTHGEVVGESVFDVYADNPQIRGAARRALAGESVHETVDVAAATFDTWYQPITDQDGDVTCVIGVSVDVTRRARYRRLLEGFQEMCRELTRTDDTQAVARLATEGGAELFDVEATSCWLADGDGLRLRATTADPPGQDAPIAREESPQYRTFETESPRLVVNAAEPSPEPVETESLLALPLGDHGTLTLLGTGPDAFGPVDRQAGEILAANVAATLDRVSR